MTFRIVIMVLFGNKSRFLLGLVQFEIIATRYEISHSKRGLPSQTGQL